MFKRFPIALAGSVLLVCCLALPTLARQPKASTAEPVRPKTTQSEAPRKQPAPTYGFGVSSDRWGWFGVNYWPRLVIHRGFYGDHVQWSYRRGY